MGDSWLPPVPGWGNQVGGGASIAKGNRAGRAGVRSLARGRRSADVCGGWIHEWR